MTAGWLIRHLSLFGLIAVLAQPMLAQTAAQVIEDVIPSDTAAEEPAPAEEGGEAAADPPPQEPLVPVLSATIPDYADWIVIAERAEKAMAGEATSLFSLNRLREELFDWRERFGARLDLRDRRIETLTNQIAALTPAGEDVDMPPEAAARQDTLIQQRADLLAPHLLIRSAHARASGLLSEVDARIRARQAEDLTERGPSPLNPTHWPQAWADLRAAVTAVFLDTRSGLSVDVESGAVWRNFPVAIVGLIAGLGLLLRGRKWVAGLANPLAGASPRWRATAAFVLSLGQIVLPLAGLMLVIWGLDRMDIWLARGQVILSALFAAGIVVILARWLNNQLFPKAPDDNGPLSYGPQARTAIRHAGVALSYGVGAIVLVDAFMGLVEASEVSVAVVILPLQLVVAYLLFRLGRALQSKPESSTRLSTTGGRIRRSIGQICMAFAVISAVLTALGYDAAALALFRPAVLTLAILGVVIVLQRLVYDIYAPADDAEADEGGPLMPVILAFLLVVLSLPFLALAWGARVGDLQEIWARFSAGFTLGDARISPGDFLTFLGVFLIGYILTRFVQGTLRVSVMPRTRLDLGGQNAVVAGVGYVGIFLAALIAITSAGIDLTSLAFVAGALSLGIGFGLQNIVQNFVSGIILLIERPIGEGDMIEVKGQMGFVRDISVRSTRIETFDRRDVIVPNADLVSDQVTNWTRGNLVGRLILKVGVAYGSDVDKVRDVLTEVAEAHPMVLADPPPQIFFMEFGDSSLNFEVRVILRDVNWIMVTRSEMNFEINAKLSEAGIEIPFPQRDLWLRNPEALMKPDGQEKPE